MGIRLVIPLKLWRFVRSLAVVKVAVFLEVIVVIVVTFCEVVDVKVAVLEV